jgi:tRNA(adenine34) deaminase
MRLFPADKFYMQTAIAQARLAYQEDEAPVGAVVVLKDKIIVKAYNQVERLSDPTAHAEILAVTGAAAFLRSKWLQDCVLYVTVEPCSMCAGALVLARIGRVVFGAVDPKTGAFGSKMNINDLKLNHKIKYKGGIMADECSQLMSDFFRKKREEKKTQTTAIRRTVN